MSATRGLLEGLLGTGEMTAENLARKFGRGTRKAVVPTAAAGGGAVVATKASEKKEAASKEEVVDVLKKHEDRETPEQEKQESEHEQKVEREEGVEKSAFWDGFEKQAVSSRGYLTAFRSALKKHKDKLTQAGLSDAHAEIGAIQTVSQKIQRHNSKETTLKGAYRNIVRGMSNPRSLERHKTRAASRGAAADELDARVDALSKRIGMKKKAVSLGWINRRMESGVASRFGSDPSVGVQRSMLDALKHYREGNRPAAIKEIRSLRGLGKTGGMKPLLAGAAAIPAVLGASGAMSSDQKPVRHAIMGMGTGAGAGAGLLGGSLLGEMLKRLAERNPEKLTGTARLGKAAPILGALIGGGAGAIKTMHWLAGLDENAPPPAAIGGEANSFGNG